MYKTTSFVQLSKLRNFFSIGVSRVKTSKPTGIHEWDGARYKEIRC
jgi:hypothetical protein